MEASGICPWLLGPGRGNDMRALGKAGEKREEKKQELRFTNTIAPPWTPLEIYSVYLF